MRPVPANGHAVRMPVDSSLVATVIHDAIIERCLRGDQRAWETVVRHHWRMMQEIGHLVDQMTEDERRAYFVESLFLNTVTYENEKLGAYTRKLTRR